MVKLLKIVVLSLMIVISNCDIYFYINFIKWKGNGDEHDGDVCDNGLFNRLCDPFFQICVSSLSNDGSCDLYKTQTRRIDNTKVYTSFPSKLQPLKFELKPEKQGGLFVSIMAMDHDSYNGDDLIDIFKKKLQITPVPNSDHINTVISGQYAHHTGGKFYLEYWASCVQHFYDQDCNTYCKEKENGNYFCDVVTGNKQCFPGWTGPNCDQDIDECIPNPCLNNGKCYQDKIDSYKCSCGFNYTGDDCEHHICDKANNCQNDGLCFGLDQCQCKLPYTGKFCEMNICDSMPCLNKGVCNATIGTCECSNGFIGKKCEKDSCTSFNDLNYPVVPCFQGNCSKGLCICNENYEGTFCNVQKSSLNTLPFWTVSNLDEKNITNSDEDILTSSVVSNDGENNLMKHYWSIIFVGLIVFVATLIIIIALLFRKLRKSKKIPFVRENTIVRSTVNGVEVIPNGMVDLNMSSGSASGSASFRNENIYSEMPEHEYSDINAMNHRKLNELQSQIRDPAVYAILPTPNKNICEYETPSKLAPSELPPSYDYQATPPPTYSFCLNSELDDENENESK